MDALISSAIEEVCSRGSTGLNLSSLWATLTPTPCRSLKASLWTYLLSVPTLQLFVNGNGALISPADPEIRRFEDVEKLDLKIVADEHLRDCFVGLYDTIGSFQRTILDRLAVAGTNGITQNQLGKDLGMEGNRLFYRLKSLECRKLIVRQQVIVKTKEADGDGDTKNTSVVNTNMLYLSRYVKQLDVRQRLELNKFGSDENVEESDINGDGPQDELLVKDYLPAMRAICDELEASNDKVLLIEDIKTSLGYRHNPGHRAWRTIYSRLKDAGIVEMFKAKVNGKIRCCLRLLKSLPANNFDAKTLAFGYDTDKEQPVKFGRRFQKTDQLLDLHIDHQIYDAIDAEGAEGATVNEICGRLRLDRKRNDSRFHNLFSRFGMCLQAENVKKTVAFRVWSRENSLAEEAKALMEKSKSDIRGNGTASTNLGNHDILGRSDEVVQEKRHSNSEVDFSNSEKSSDTGNILESCCISPGDETNHALCSSAKVSEFLQEPTSMASGEKPVSMESEMSVASSEITLSGLPKSGSNRMLPYLPFTSDAALREKRILEWLQVIFFKQMAKLQAPEESYSEKFSFLNTNSYSLESEFGSSSTPNKEIHKHGHGFHKCSQQTLRNYAFHRKFMKCLSKGTFVSTRVHKSLPACNAVELLKLVFMNTSATPEVQNHLAEILQHYSEHDLFAAFNYLREKKFLIGGDGDRSFVLSQQFLLSVSKSSFPFHTGKRAAKFCDWIHEREKDLVEGEINLPSDLHCGDIFQLFALVSSGELSISPCVPDEGVGEIGDPRSSKRKAEDDSEHSDGENFKRMRTLGGEIISRKEKGFPGIKVLMPRARFSTFDSNDVFCQKNISASSQCDRIQEILESDSATPTMKFPVDLPWEAVMGCADLILKSDSNKVSFSGPEIVKTIYMAIKKAGGQGLSLEEISRVAGDNTHEHLIDILQGFGYVLKVNAYDSVRVVDALFRSKYFLTASTGSHAELGRYSVKMHVHSIEDHQSVTQSENWDSFGEKSPTSNYDVHKGTFLNCPEAAVPETEPHRKTSEDRSHVPILPWINGDGSINKVENIIHQIDVLNPQSCRSLLDMMILDKHIIVRKMYESVSCGHPSLLGSLFGTSFNKSKSGYRKHLFANPMSVSKL